MRTTLARILLLVVVTGCGNRSTEPGVNVDLASHETTTRSDETSQAQRGLDLPDGHYQISSDISSPVAQYDLELPLAENRMALEEGKAGKRDADRTRQQALELARSAGVLGSTTLQQRPGLRSLAGPTAPLDQAWDEQRPSAEGYKHYEPNAWFETMQDRRSTFAADVDTASYTIARRKLTEGALPPADSVRVEEMVNYFTYAYPQPPANQPFAVTSDLAPSPFDGKRHILRVGVSTKQLSVSERTPASLVFLVDVSGSMQSPDKLGLAKQSLRILVDNLKDGDTVSLVTYAGATRVVLPPVGLDHKRDIFDAIEQLDAGGGTAMGEGIALAYEQAAEGLRPGRISRVIILSDGDANIGTVGHDDILATIAGKVKEGVTLSTIGFGMGNYKDEQMEQLANKGNGNNFYIDTISQARRVFQDQLGSTLEVVAKDVKLQVELDPDRVKRYRLIGYENRDIADADFRDDRVDAGEIGAGHQVTALYEVELVGDARKPLGLVHVRHKAPTGIVALESAFALASKPAATFYAASADLRFAFSAAAFADVLRGSPDARDWTLAAIQAIAAGAAIKNADRHELVQLIGVAIELRAADSI